MRKALFAVAVLGVAVLMAGCATTRTSTSSIESRLDVLESRLQVLEGQSGAAGEVNAQYEVKETQEASVSPDSLTKKQIQMALRNAGYYDGAVDGKIGPRTKSAIKKFQADMGLKADGVAGRNTREKLVKYLP